MKTFNLERYLSNGVENIVKGIVKASAKNLRAGMFMMQYAKDSSKARKLREKAEERGEHIPPFLIASITNQCNLHCKGCYARANHACFDSGENLPKTMKAEEWSRIFGEAAECGISFILLAGGEPFVRKDVIKEAAKQKKILFPIFTNGTMADEEYMELFEKERNLLPILSIEGNQKTTDERRGTGMYAQLQKTMCQLKERGILYGASVTVHKHNIQEVLSEEFTRNLADNGCKSVIYVEYVPMDEKSKEAVFDDDDRETFLAQLNEKRERESEMLFIAFPGDEKTSGGCLAAGRGFFHINANGGAEPCPFSPYSDTNLREVSLREALQSPLFLKLQQNGNLLQEHIGGCVLFEQRHEVEALAKG